MKTPFAPFLRVIPGLLLLGVPVLRADEKPPAPPALYERVEAKLATHPHRDELGRPPAELREVEWMLGEWTIETTVFADVPSATDSRPLGSTIISRVLNDCWLQMDDRYPDGGRDLGFLTFNVITQRWVSIGLDGYGNAVQTTAERWQDGRAVFEAAAAEIIGEKVHLRQTIEKISPDEFLITNAEYLADGTWRKLDEYRYRRRQ